MPNIEKRKGSGQEVFEPKDLVLELIEAGKVGSLADKLTNDEINEILKAFSSMKQAKAKGGNIEKQMELFQDGGLKDEGNTKDPVSGNDVPPGATQEEVRDDIPAQLSEGEFVFPADVVRYIGLEKLMMMRQEAKAGLRMMEQMGQMGNADEATIPDDIPFSIIDIEIEEGEDDEVEKRAQGGVIEAANGFAGTTTTTNPLQTRQSSMTATPMGLQTTYTAPKIPPITPSPIGGFKPMGGFTDKSPVDATKRATYKGLFGGDELTQGPDEYRTYVNDAGAEIQIPFKNGKILVGFSIPEGFKAKTDTPKDTKIQTAKTKTTRVESESGSDDPDPAGLGGARVTLGNDVEYAVQYGLDGSVSLANVGDAIASGKANFGQLTPEAASLVRQQALGQIAQLAYGVNPKVAVATELAKKFGVEIPGVSKVKGLIQGAEDATKTLNGMSLGQIFDMGRTELDKSFVDRSGVDRGNVSFSAAGVEGLSEKEMRDIQAEMQYGRGTERFSEARASKISRDAEAARQKEVARQEAIQKAALDAAERKRAADRIAANRAAQEKAERENRVTGREAGMSMGDDGGSDDSPSQDSGMGGMGDVGYSTAVGGFIPRLKKKPKTKKMKRGGLASR